MMAAAGLPSTIGRYRVVDRIGKGAMGVVYSADDEAMGRRVAIKVMMADLEEEPETRERFYREAKVTGQLVHRNIVTVFDLGEDRNRPYIVMELVDGVPLADYMKTEAAQPIEAKIALMIQVCEGLQVAHDRGVTHRDVKPSNLFVMPDGALKILDFGVARLASSNLTATGFLVGTPDYMSPEQAQGRTVDARSDQFSAAAVFYFMLAGRAPFASPDLPKVLHGVIHDDPAPLADAQAPEMLRRVLARAMAKAPADRYATCADLAAELGRVRRAVEGDGQRVAQAALDRYRQILVLLDERRQLQADVLGAEATCDEIAARLAERFPDLARLSGDGSLMEPMDRSVANAALAVLQAQYNRELAAVAALRIEPATDQDAGVDRTLVRHTVVAPAPASSLRARARAFWGRMGSSRGQSTTEWLMLAGMLTTIAIWYVNNVPTALGIFMKAMATSLRTVAP